MRKGTYCWVSTLASLILCCCIVLPASASGVETGYHLGEGALINAGKDTGFAESNPIDKDDPHWDWSLGTFYLSGYTRQMENESGELLFLKNVGDTVTLWFSLNQDINCLNGDERLSIASDKNGFDQNLGVAQQDFGRGMLIVKHTDYLNHSTVTTYRDFLAAEASTTADTEVSVFEEGDYEIALDYEIREAHLNLFGWEPLPSYHNYRISFKFSVRNGNTMIFPRDVETGAELINGAITEHGFVLDLAQSRYLDIDIKKEVLQEGTVGLVEDVRFNKPAKDGSEFTDEGIYSITVTNRYTGQQTIKKIYVGTNDMLKAYVVTGMSLQDIQEQVALGATITENGTLIAPDGTMIASQTQQPVESEHVDDTHDSSELPGVQGEAEASDGISVALPVVLLCLGIGVLLGVVAVIFKWKRKRLQHEERGEEQ